MSGPHGSGSRSIAAESISGIAATGDHVKIIVPQLPADGIPAPDEVRGKPLWNVAHRPSRMFIGRVEELAQLAAPLDADGPIGRCVVGLGGVGKTELVLRHLWTHRDRYSGVWWLTADGPANITAGLASLARQIVPAIAALPDEQAEQWAMAWLHHHPGWLLVLDNVEDPAHIDRLLANADGGHVLVTTRRDIDWSRHGLGRVRLGVLSNDEAVRLILEQTGQDDGHTAAHIATELGNLPLALDQASAYVAHHDLRLSVYWQQLSMQPKAAYAGVAPGRDPEQAVSRVWLFTLAALNTADPLAVRVLAFLAWLAPDVPRDLVATLTGNQTAADRALGLLSSYSMISLKRDSVSVHRLVQAVVRAKPDHSAEAADAGRGNSYRCAVAVLAKAIPRTTEPEHWPRWRVLYPHIFSIAEHRAAPDRQLARLLHQTALFEYGQGHYWLAQYHQALALTILERSDHPDRTAMAAVLTNLAAGWRELGQLDIAVRSCKQALTIIQAAYGADHPMIAPIVNILASAYHTQGRPDKAAPLFRQALAIHQRVQDRRNAALVQGNLASCYLELGRAGDAVLLSEQAMAVTIDEYGPNHPETAMCLTNLASCYALVGRHWDANHLGRKALTKLDVLFGNEHPVVARLLGNLASTHSTLGHHREALRLGQQAVDIAERLLPADHPTADHLRSLLASLMDTRLKRRDPRVRLGDPSRPIRRGNLPLSVGDTGRYLMTPVDQFWSPRQSRPTLPHWLVSRWGIPNTRARG